MYLCVRGIAGADPGFQVRGGGALKKIATKIFGVFRVKNHDFTPKNNIFSNFRGAPPPPGSTPVSTFVSIYDVSIGFLFGFVLFQWTAYSPVCFYYKEYTIIIPSKRNLIVLHFIELINCSLGVMQQLLANHNISI